MPGGSRAEQTRRHTERVTTVSLKGTDPRGRAQRWVAQVATWGPVCLTTGGKSEKVEGADGGRMLWGPRFRGGATGKI